MSKTCEKHPSSSRYRGRCTECGREKALAWNRANREKCLIRNRQYQVEKKTKIAERKSRNYKANPEKYKLMARATLLKAKYGLSLDEYNIMLKEQGGVCRICRKKETQKSNKKGGVDSLRVDHCHQTGKVRGLLCSKCNFGIAQFNDDVDLLKRAIRYLHNELKK